MQPTDSERLADFVSWFNLRVHGDEKGEAQVFLDRLFQAFGQGGSLDVGGQPEFRVRKAKEDGGGISFADYVWKPVVLIEMKKRGASLQQHRKQAFDYWTYLVPNRPRYVVLCNFDEFWVYDFETDLDEPKDKISTRDLPDRWGALAFLAPGSPSPLFQADRVAVTQDAAALLAQLLTSLLDRKIDRELAQKFLMQSLIALFSEDIGFLPKYFYTRLLDECRTPAQSYDLIGGLFEAMNQPTGAGGGRFKAVPYFNGGVFRDPAHLELTPEEVDLLRKAAGDYNWSKVQPEIFGALFQHSLDKESRHALGAHFTHPVDIMKIVGPTIVEPWRARVEGARTLSSLQSALTRLHRYRVLDPACGSGNFLYVAYRELKRIEARILERMREESKREAKRAAQLKLSFLTARNMYGIDMHPLAIDVAKVTMVIARKLANDELHITEPELPLDNLDDNFLVGDALVGTDGTRTHWPDADVIIGNPPFISSKFLRKERDGDYVKRVRQLYPEIPGMADYCVHWFYRAHEHLPSCTEDDPVRGRAGLVGTQNIAKSKSRVAGLDRIVASGTIVEAVQSQPWPGEAAVKVSLVNWVKTKEPRLLPKTRRLWFTVEQAKRAGRVQENSKTQPQLDFRECPFINSALSDDIDLSGVRVLGCNTDPQRAFQGITPGDNGFVLSEEEKARILANDPESQRVIFPYLIGKDLLKKDGRPSRFVIDFGQMSILAARKYRGAFAHVTTQVLPVREKQAAASELKYGESPIEDKQALDKWWLLWRSREDMKGAFVKLRGRYVAASRTQKYPFIYCFVSTSIVPSDVVQTFAFDDDYSFGILQSIAHSRWYAAICGRSPAGSYKYSRETVFDTFPWPQAPAKRQVESIADAAVAIRRLRDTARDSEEGLRSLYDTLALPGASSLKEAHRELDDAVLGAYGFRRQQNILQELLRLNSEVAEKVAGGGVVTGPGLPREFKRKAETVDCIR